MTRELLHKVWIGMTRNVAFTAPGAEDPRLRGRTYAIPFEDVWQASLRLIDGGLKRWELLEQDDREGIIRGRVRGRTERFTSSITVRISLDVDAQTRVDALAGSNIGRFDLGTNARRLHRFFRALDEALQAHRPRGARPLRSAS